MRRIILVKRGAFEYNHKCMDESRLHAPDVVIIYGSSPDPSYMPGETMQTGKRPKERE